MTALIDDPGLAVLASVTRWAGASVRALACVQAGGSVVAGVVVGAVVEVLVAEEPAPSGMAVALVGLLAGAMFATRVPFALVAMLSGPTRTASGSKKSICLKKSVRTKQLKDLARSVDSTLLIQQTNKPFNDQFKSRRLGAPSLHRVSCVKPALNTKYSI